MGESLFTGTGLISIAEDGNSFEGDKYQNLMLKRLSAEEANVLVGQGLKLLESGVEEYYQIKYIDFGLSKLVDEGNSRCVGGTPGYIAWEFKEKSIKHDKIDLFALAITLIDNEMITMNLTNLGSIFSHTQSKRFDKGSPAFDKDDESILENNDLVQLLTRTINNASYSERYRARVKNRIPNIEVIVHTKYDSGSWSRFKPSSFMYIRTDVFEVMIVEALYFLPERDIFSIEQDRKLDRLTGEIQTLKRKLRKEVDKKSETAKNLQESIEFRNKCIEFLEKVKTFRVLYFRTLLCLIIPYTLRPSNEQALESIMALMKAFKTDNAEFMVVLLNKDFKTIIKESGQRSEEEQQKANQLLEQRKLKFATVYNLESSQFNRENFLLI